MGVEGAAVDVVAVPPHGAQDVVAVLRAAGALGEEQEQLEEELVDRATASQTPEELRAEIVILEGLEAQAKAVATRES